MAREARKSRFRDFGVHLHMCDMHASVCAFSYFSYWALKVLLLCNNFGTCTNNPYPKNACTCVYAYWGRGLFVQPLSSLLPTVLCCWPCMSAPQPVVATVDPLICYPTFPVQEGNREPGQLLPQRPDLDCLIPRGNLNVFFYRLTNAK